MAQFREVGLAYDAAVIGRKGVVLEDEASEALEYYGHYQPDAID